MDVPDIQLVLQWRATCKLSTLWQRFGWAAWNKELCGTAILFAEKEHFDDERAARVERQEQRKRKAATAGVSATQRSTKRSNLNFPNDLPKQQSDVMFDSLVVMVPQEHGSGDMQESEGEDSDGPGGGEMPILGGQGKRQWIEDMKEALRKKRTTGRVERKQKKELDIGMDYFINTKSRMGLGCRRKVLNVYFDNTAAGESFVIMFSY